MSPFTVCLLKGFSFAVVFRTTGGTAQRPGPGTPQIGTPKMAEAMRLDWERCVGKAALAPSQRELSALGEAEPWTGASFALETKHQHRRREGTLLGDTLLQ